MKALHEKQQLGGGFDEDLNYWVGVVKTLSNMCDKTEDHIFGALTIMFKNYTLKYFSAKKQYFKQYPDVIDFLNLILSIY